MDIMNDDNDYLLLNTDVEDIFVELIELYKHYSLNSLLTNLAFAFNNINTNNDISNILTQIITTFHIYSFDNLSHKLVNAYYRVYNIDNDLNFSFDNISL